MLKRLGLTKALAKNTVSQESNVAGIVSKVGLGSADVGFAYVTDGKIANDRVSAITPAEVRPAARSATRSASSGAAAPTPRGARAFIAKVRSSRGRSLLKKAGFGLPPKG